MSVLRLQALEVNAVHHCNLSCVGCSHASPVSPKRFAVPSEVYRDFAGLAGTVVVDHVKVVGGEPLLHPDLAGLLTAVRESGIGGRIRVATNATMLHRAGWAWLDVADDVHVSRYPGAAIRADTMIELAARCTAQGKQLLVKSYRHFRLLEPADRLSVEDARLCSTAASSPTTGVATRSRTATSTCARRRCHRIALPPTMPVVRSSPSRPARSAAGTAFSPGSARGMLNMPGQCR